MAYRPLAVLLGRSNKSRRHGLRLFKSRQLDADAGYRHRWNVWYNSTHSKTNDSIPYGSATISLVTLGVALVGHQAIFTFLI